MHLDSIAVSRKRGDLLCKLDEVQTALDFRGHSITMWNRVKELTELC